MKTAALLLLLTTASTCSSGGGGGQPAQASGGGGGAVEFRNVQSGGYAATTPSQPRAQLAADAESYKRLWDSLIGNGNAAPSVDFGKETIVFFLAGQRNTGGYTIVVNGAKLEGTTLVVDAAVQGPPPDAMVTQAITSPWAVAAFATRDAKDVRWQR